MTETKKTAYNPIALPLHQHIWVHQEIAETQIRTNISVRSRGHDSLPKYMTINPPLSKTNMTMDKLPFEESPIKIVMFHCYKGNPQ